jgi:A/G-specific adenine glycosylase
MAETFPGESWNQQDIRAFRSSVLDFFQSAARDLPWRESRDPYRILVSEFMLQQTRVDTVVPYFRRWMDRFPTWSSLSEAAEADVLHAWQGLGYYSRARRLHQVAREVHRDHAGSLPESPAELRRFPGIGPYTAGAVASIAFGRPEPAVDGNVRRVLARLTDTGSPRQSDQFRLAGRLIDPESPGEFNQAMMEIGSLVCTPRMPACDRCPISRFCQARRAGTQENRPKRRARPGSPRKLEAVVVLALGRPGSGGAAHEPRYLMRRRRGSGFLGGMWEFPGVRIESPGQARGAARRLVRDLVTAFDRAEDVAVVLGHAELPPFEHVYSHVRIRYLPFVFQVHATEFPAAVPRDFDWMTGDSRNDIPIPGAHTRIWDSLAAAGHVTRFPVQPHPVQEE